jgi:hypothetical protein
MAMMNDRLPSRSDPWSPIRLAAGWLLVPVGLLITPLPIPVGLLLVAIGLALLVRESRFVRRRVRALRVRFPRLSRRLRAMEGRMPGLIRSLLRRTDPRRRRTGRGD